MDTPLEDEVCVEFAATAPGKEAEQPEQPVQVAMPSSEEEVLPIDDSVTTRATSTSSRLPSGDKGSGGHIPPCAPPLPEQAAVGTKPSTSSLSSSAESPAVGRELAAALSSGALLSEQDGEQPTAFRPSTTSSCLAATAATRALGPGLSSTRRGYTRLGATGCVVVEGVRYSHSALCKVVVAMLFYAWRATTSRDASTMCASQTAPRERSEAPLPSVPRAPRSEQAAGGTNSGSPSSSATAARQAPLSEPVATGASRSQTRARQYWRCAGPYGCGKLNPYSTWTCRRCGTDFGTS
jgi:hypothetical protein